MDAAKENEIPPLLECVVPPSTRAPTLVAIVVYKLLKGLVLVLLAFGIYSVRNLNLQEEFRLLLEQARLSQDAGFFADAKNMLSGLTPAMLQLVIAGSVLYGVFSLVEGIGLFLRAGWAGWMAIVESGVFVPFELFDLSRGFTVTMAVILILNVAILWYLLACRKRLFPSRTTA